MGWYGYRPYVSVAQRQANARREAAKYAKQGRKLSPVHIEGRKIATTFWGKAWCENLEAYSDFSNRLPRGRRYVCNGSVIDLQIEEGKITALVSGSELYEITIQIAPLSKERWKAVKSKCAGQIGSLIELLQGRLSKSVMDVVTERDRGLFPKPSEIELDCSCPDWANMCKHVAAVLYGVGARLDEEPALLFKLREVDHLELIEAAGAVTEIGKPNKRGQGAIEGEDLADIFGIELADPVGSEPQAPAARAKRSAKRTKAQAAPAEKKASRAPRKTAKVATAAATAASTAPRKKAAAKRATASKVQTKRAAARKTSTPRAPKPR